MDIHTLIDRLQPSDPTKVFVFPLWKTFANGMNAILQDPIPTLTPCTRDGMHEFIMRRYHANPTATIAFLQLLGRS